MAQPGQLTIGETLTVFNNNIEVSGTDGSDGSWMSPGLATVNAQLNVLTLPINIQSMAQLTTPAAASSCGQMPPGISRQLPGRQRLRHERLCSRPRAAS